MSDSGGGIPIFWLIIGALWFFDGDSDDEEVADEPVVEQVSQGLISDEDKYPVVDRVAEATAHIAEVTGDTAVADGTQTVADADTSEWGW